MSETCAICGCSLHRGGDYAKPTVKGRSHATRHHYVAERFFGRTANRPGKRRLVLFKECPWGVEGQTGTFCYECHEEMLHNPVFLPQDIEGLKELVVQRGLFEKRKTRSRQKLVERVKLLQEAVSTGIRVLLSQEKDE